MLTSPHRKTKAEKLAQAPSPKAPAAEPKTFEGATWQERFLKAYEAYGLITKAAKAAGIGAGTVARYRDGNPDFQERMAEAHARCVDELEHDLALLGRNHKNVIALLARLKAERPEKYEEKLRIDARMASVNVTTALPPAEAQQLLRTMLAEATSATKEQLALPPAGSSGTGVILDLSAES